MSAIVIDRLTDPSAFLARYRALFEKARAPRFFQSPAWVEAWLSGTPARAALYVVEAPGKLIGVVAVAPRGAPLVSERQLRLFEYGDPQRDAIYTEYNDFLIDSDLSEEKGAALRIEALRGALAMFSGVDALVVRNATAALKDAAQAAAALHERRFRALSEQPVFGADLNAMREAGGDYLAQLSSSLRAKIRRAQRLYEERGPLTYSVAKGADHRRRVWGKLIALHQESWRARGQKGVFANPHFLAFHQRVAELAPAAVRLVEIRAGTETIGVLYQFDFAGRLYGYQSGLLFEDDNRLTPGYVAHVMSVQDALNEGRALYDFLAGDSDYKRRLGEQTDTLYSFAIENLTPRNRLRRLLRR